MPAALLVLCVTASAQAPSAPPLVPLEAAQPEDTERYQPAPAPVPAAPYRANVDATEPPSRAKRLAGTLIATVVGDALTFGVWMLQLGLLGSSPSNELLGVVTVLTVAGLAPFGTLIGDRIGGGNTPYWKVLLGTLAGAAVAGIFVGLLSYTGTFDRNPGLGIAGAAASAVPFMLGQVLSTEVGAPD